MSPIFVVLLSAFQLINAQYYEDRMLTGDGAGAETTVASIDECVKSCTGGCSAVSFDWIYYRCIKSACGTLQLAKQNDWTTVVIGSPIVEGGAIPRATHEWGMTDTCGLKSTGIFKTPSLYATGTSFKVSPNALYGKAMYFPNTQNTAGSLAQTWQDASLYSAYGSADASFAVSVFVNFEVLPSNACLFEFTDGAKLSWHFWLWPTVNQPYANLIDSNWASQSYNQAFQFQANKWYHVAFSYDASSAILTTYVNGAALGQNQARYIAKYKFDRLTIGGRTIPGSGLGYFQGSMYGVSTYNQSLSAAQAVELMNSGTVGKVVLL